MGSRAVYAETVLTCEGNFYAPDFSNQLSIFCKKFESLITNDEQPLFYVKVEPWNSIRVWLQLPAEASERLKTLANEQAAMLRDLGVLTVRIKEENSVISFNLQSENMAASCTSPISQDSAGSSLSVVNFPISLDSHYSTSHQVSENSQELNSLANQRSNTCRKTDGDRKSTLSFLADRERCCNSETCAKHNPLSFYCKTAAETLDSNDTLVTNQTTESGFSKSGSSVFKSLMNEHFVGSRAMTLNGFHNSHLKHSHKFSGDHLLEGRYQGNDSLQHSYKSADSCLLETVCSNSEIVAKSSEAKTHSTEGDEHILGSPSDERPSRKRKSNDLDVDTGLSVLPSVTNDCHHPSTVCRSSVAGVNSSSEAESATRVSFESLHQHSTNMRCIVNPYTGEMENVPDDENLVMPHCAHESAVSSNQLLNSACYSADPATGNTNPTFNSCTAPSNGHKVLLDSDRFISVDNFLQSILARLEASSSSDENLLNLLNSVVDNEVLSRLLAESGAKPGQSGKRLSSQPIQAPQQNGIGHCTTDNYHSKRPLYAPTIDTTSNEGHVLGPVCKHQNVSTDSAVACKGVSNMSGCHSSTKALQLQHPTEVSSANASSQMNLRHLLQQGALGTMASQTNKLHQVQVARCSSGIKISRTNAGHNFQKEAQDNLGNMVRQLGAMVSAECHPEKVTRGMSITMNSQPIVRHQFPQTRYQLQQVKDTSHEFHQIGEFSSGNAAHEDALQYNPLQSVPGKNSRTAASRLTSSDQFQRFSGFSERTTAAQMCTYRKTNGLSQNMVSEKIRAVALADFQSTTAQTDATISSEKCLVRRISTGKDATSSTSKEPISEAGHYRLTDGDLLNGIFHRIPQTHATISGVAALSAQSSTYKCPAKKSRPREQSKRTSSSVGKNSQASSLNNSVNGRQVKPVTKSQPTVAQLLDEARAKQSVSAVAHAASAAAGSMTVSSFLETHATGAWQKQMPNVALINLLPYSQPLPDFQCSAMEVLPLSLPRPSSSMPSLIAVPLRNIGLTEQESGLPEGVTFIQGDAGDHRLSAFLFEQCQRLMQPVGVNLLSSTDVKEELLESRASADSVSVKTESTSCSSSPATDRAIAAERRDEMDSRIAVKQEL